MTKPNGQGEETEETTVEAPAAEETVELEEGDLTHDQINNLLSYDPFEPGAGPGEEPETPTQEEEDAGARTAEPPETPPVEESPPTPEPAPAPEGETPRERLLREQNEMLQQHIQTLQGTAPAPNRPAAPEEPQEDPFPAYNQSLRVTDEIVNAIASGEPDQIRAAINSISQGVAHIVHREVRGEYRDHLRSSIGNYVNSQIKSTREQDEIVRDFYGTYPQFDSPPKRAAIVHIAAGMWKPGQKWDATFRDRLAQEAARELGVNLSAPSPGGGRTPEAPAPAAPKKPKSPAAPAKARPPAQTGISSRPPVGPLGSSQGDDVFDTLFGKD